MRAFCPLLMALVWISSCWVAWAQDPLRVQLHNIEARTVLMIPDLEGHDKKLDDWVRKNSDYVRWSSDGESIEIIDPKRTAVVSGGDVSGRAPGDLRALRLLVNMKKQYPNNVALLTGNRDGNMAFLGAPMESLDDGVLSRNPTDDSQPWRAGLLGQPIQEFKRENPNSTLTWKSLIDWATTKADGNDSANTVYRVFSEWASNRQYGLGGHDYFENRRLQLGPQASDAEVAKNFADSMSMTDGTAGPMLEYLRHSQRGVLANGTLITHARLSPTEDGRYGYVPNELSGQPGEHAGPREFIRRLNEEQRKLVDVMAGGSSTPQSRAGAHEAALALGNYARTQTGHRDVAGSTEYSIAMDQEGNPWSLDEKYVEWLRQDGIRASASFHKPGLFGAFYVHRRMDDHHGQSIHVTVDNSFSLAEREGRSATFRLDGNEMHIDADVVLPDSKGEFERAFAVLDPYAQHSPDALLLGSRSADGMESFAFVERGEGENRKIQVLKGKWAPSSENPRAIDYDTFDVNLALSRIMASCHAHLRN